MASAPNPPPKKKPRKDPCGCWELSANNIGFVSALVLACNDPKTKHLAPSSHCNAGLRNSRSLCFFFAWCSQHPAPKPRDQAPSTLGPVLGSGSWVLGCGCWVLGIGSWVLRVVMVLVLGLGCGALGTGFRVLGLRSLVVGLWRRVLGSGCLVLGLGC